MAPLAPPALPRLRRPAPGESYLEAVSWAGGVSVLSCGVRIGVRADDPAVLDRLPPYLPPGARPTPRRVDYLYSLRWMTRPEGDPGRVLRLYVETWPTAESEDVDDLLDGLRTRAELRVAVNAPARLFVHAGVVAWRGRAIVIPGSSGSGKTTLTTALVRAGARYYSDEFAVLDEQGRVHPWPRRLRLRLPEGGIRHCPVEELGGRAGVRPLPVGLVVATRYREGARWRPRVLARSEGVLALLKHTVIAREQPERCLRVLTRALAGAEAVAGPRGAAPEAAAAILRRLGRRGRGD
jgi:hypothetical protein